MPVKMLNNCIKNYLLLPFLLGCFNFPKTFSATSIPSSLEKMFIQKDGEIECTIPNPRLNWELFDNQAGVLIIKGLKQSDQIENEKVFILNCTATFPLDIKVDREDFKHLQNISVSSESPVSFVRNAENVFNEATFVYSIGLLDDLIPIHYKLWKISIFKYGESDMSKYVTISIFRNPGSPNFIKKAMTKEVVIESKAGGELTIPCISPDPNIEPILSPKDSNFEYHVTQGFIGKLGKAESALVFNCSLFMDAQEVPDLIFKIAPKQEIYVFPSFSAINLFEDDKLTLICRSNRTISITGNLSGVAVKSTTTLESHEYTSILEIRASNHNQNLSEQLFCTEKVNENVTNLHSWTVNSWNILDNPIISLTKVTENLVHCSGSTGNKIEISAIFCKGEANCKFSKRCFEEGSDCINVKTGNFNTSSVSSSYLQFIESDPTYTQGILQCKSGNYSYTTQYFRGFDGKLYLDWRKAPVSALIEVFVPPKNITMYPHNSYPFGCRASPFISDGKIQWVIRGKDGSEILLHKNRVDVIPPYYKLDASLYTVRESNIRLIYPNDYDVLCLVPHFNATGSMRYHKRINVAAHKAPVMEILIGAGCIILLLIIPLVVVMRRLKKAREAIRNLTEKEVEEFIKGDPTTLNAKDKDINEKIVATPYNHDLEIPRNKLLIDNENKLGEGAFGLVLKGKVEGMSDVVAVKTVKPRCEVDQFKGFLSELKIMMHIGRHPHIISLIGAHTDKIREKIIYIVVEYCANGSLEKLLRDHKHLYTNQIDSGSGQINKEIGLKDIPENGSMYVNDFGEKLKTVNLLHWCYQIADALDYLSVKKVVHADVACRNVLIHENFVAKITDFGLSRQLANYTQYVKKHQEPLPWRWMSEESLRNLTFSTKSDVWAYGVTLWEIWSLGDVPYPGLAWTVNFVDSLANGLRMSRPTYATSYLYDTMLSCWHHEPESRPTFAQLANNFKLILESLDEDIKNPPQRQQTLNTIAQNSEGLNTLTTNKRSTNANLYENQLV